GAWWAFGRRLVVGWGHCGAGGRGSFVGSVFFLQAEDGIRYWSVTGVQTCALPIYRVGDRRGDRPDRRLAGAGWRQLGPVDQRDRSEERRVGKEWRSRRGPYN